MRMYRIALALCIAALVVLSAAYLHERSEAAIARQDAIVVQNEAARQRERAVNTAEENRVLQGQLRYEESAIAYGNALFEQEKNRQRRIENGTLTPGWLSRRLAIERGVIVRGRPRQ